MSLSDQQLATLSPDALVARYATLAGGTNLLAETQTYGPLSGTETANLFAYNLAAKTLNRAPTPAEIISGPGQLTAANVGQIAAAQAAAAPPTQTTTPPTSNTTPTGTLAPATSSDGGITMDSVTPGGTPTSFASQYSFGAGSSLNAQQAPTITASPSDSLGILPWILGGAVVLYFLGVFKHG